MSLADESPVGARYMAEEYFELDNLPTLDRRYLSLAQNANYIYPDPEQPRSQVIGCLAHEFANTKFITDLKQHFGHPRVLPAFLKNPPMTVYDWHRDIAHAERGARLCGINFLLTPEEKVFTLFKVPNSATGRLIHGVKILPYRPFRPVLFNTQETHCVINLTDQDRLILSVGFHDVAYEDAKDWLIRYQCDAY